MDGDNLSAPKMNEDYSNLTLHYEEVDIMHTDSHHGISSKSFMASWSYKESEMKLFYKQLKQHSVDFGLSLEENIIQSIIHETLHPIIMRFLLIDGLGMPRQIHIPHICGLDLSNGVFSNNFSAFDCPRFLKYHNESGIVRESGRYNIMKATPNIQSLAVPQPSSLC